MYLLYIDESGVSDPSSATRHFVLCGIAIPAEEWRETDQKINLIKRKYRLENVEIHTGWMARKYPEQDRIPDFLALSDLERQNQVNSRRRTALKLKAATQSLKQVKELKKKFRKTEPYIHLAFQERINCLQELADEISRWNNSRLFAEGVDKRFASGDQDQIYENAFSQVITRFQAFLDNRSRFLQQNLSGLIIQDHNQTVSDKLTQLMRKFYRQGTIWRNITRIVETPLFVDSALTSMVQMADLCSYAIRRFFDNGEDDLFNRIYSRADRSGDIVVGIRHYTGPNRCDCKVCKDHNR